MYKVFTEEYSTLLADIYDAGFETDTRNGMTVRLVNQSITFNDLEEGCFPVYAARQTPVAMALAELKTFLQGPKSLKDFKKNGCNYWGMWAEGDKLEVDYGNAWTDWNGHNQLADVVRLLINDPTNRRILISGWRPDRLKELSLPCCHLYYQFTVTDGKLNLLWVQRSADMTIGVPADATLAAGLVIILAEAVGLKPGSITMMFGDAHIYAEHHRIMHQRGLNAIHVDAGHKYSIPRHAPLMSVNNWPKDLPKLLDPTGIKVANLPTNKIKFKVKK